MKVRTLTPLSKTFRKEITAPASKSYTNRALILAALTERSVTIRNPLICDDTRALIDCLTALEIKIVEKKSSLEVVGSIKNIQEKHYDLNAGLSGTTMRFLLPILAFTPGKKLITGEIGLRKRPVGDLVTALRDIGADIEYKEKEGHLPLIISGTTPKNKHAVVSGAVSSQYLSALLLSASALGLSRIDIKDTLVSKPYIDMTLECLRDFCVNVAHDGYRKFYIGSPTYSQKTYQVEGDYSSAGYFFAMAALTKSNLTIKNLNPQSLQADKKLLGVLEQMGNKITFGKNSVTIHGKGILPISVDMADFPDQAQTLAVLAAFAEGKSMLSGLGTLVVKETNRLEALLNELGKMGIKITKSSSTLTLYGGRPHGAVIDTYGDHRMAMAFALAGAKISGVKIADPDVVTKTFPDFWRMLEQLGIKSEVTGAPPIALIGMRGSGKTTVGQLLAKKMGYKYYDTDHLIEEQTKKTISEIVASEGWEKFREYESRILTMLAPSRDAVISTGGGIITRPNNIELLKKNSVCILLDAPISVLQKNIQGKKNLPPLLPELSQNEEIWQVYTNRKHLYEQTANHVVSINGKKPNQIAREISMIVKN